MALSKSDQAAVKKAAAAGGLSSSQGNAIAKGAVVSPSSSSSSSSGSSSGSSSSSTPAPTPAPTSTISTITDPVTGQKFTRDTSVPGSTYQPVGSSSSAPIATMGTVAKDPAKNVSTPSTTLPANQTATSGTGIASGISIDKNGNVVIAPSGGGTSSNTNTASLLMTSYPGATVKSSGTTSGGYQGGSIVDYLASIGKPSDFGSRATLAEQYGISNYSGTADQNTQLLNKMRGGSGASSAGAATTGAATTGQTYTPTPTTATTTTTTGSTLGTPTPYVNTPTTQTPSTATNTGLYGQLITDQANRSKSSPEYVQAQNAYQKAVSDYNALKQSMDTELANIDLEPGSLHFQQGRKQVLSQLYAQRLADAEARVTQAQQAMSYATAQYGAQNQALQGAIGAAGVTLQGGQYMPFGGDGATMAAGIANATKWAIAQQNMAQGANYQGQAQELSNALQSMAPLGQKLTDFMTRAGLNPATAPLINTQISRMDAQLYPDAVATMNAAVNDIRSYAIQILGSQSGANPTDVTAAVSSFDFGSFTPVQLNTLFRNLENMGMVRLSQAQSASQAGYNANLTGGGAAAQGMSAHDLGALDTGGKISSSDVNNTLKAFGGVGLGVGQALGGLTGIAAQVLGI